MPQESLISSWSETEQAHVSWEQQIRTTREVVLKQLAVMVWHKHNIHRHRTRTKQRWSLTPKFLLRSDRIQQLTCKAHSSAPWQRTREVVFKNQLSFTVWHKHFICLDNKGRKERWSQSAFYYGLTHSKPLCSSAIQERTGELVFPMEWHKQYAHYAHV